MSLSSEASKLLSAFYATIEPSVEAAELPGKTWRKVDINGTFVAAFYVMPVLTKAVQCLLKDKRISEKYSQSYLESMIAERLIAVYFKIPEKACEQINYLGSELLNSVPKEMNVYMRIHGLSINMREKIGQYEFVPAGEYEKLNIKCYHQKKESHIKEHIWQNHDHVMVSVSACDSVKAQEKAYSEFQWLENAARLFVDFDFYDVGITSFNSSHVENSLVTDDNGMVIRTSSRVKGSPVPLPFLRIFEKDNNLYRVVNKLGFSISCLTQLQQRIHHAVYLGGLSVHEKVPEVSYFLGVSAFEALFQKETDKYVNPSIAQQIIESFCYLVADESHRRNVFETMRPFYGKRSAFAHGGKTIVSIGDLDLLRAYLRAAILKLIDDPELSRLKTIDEVAALICDKKFGAKINVADKNGGR